MPADSTSEAEKLLQRVCAGENDKLANLLLSRFHQGFPVEKLRRLLEADEHCVRIAVWLASELGEKARPLFAQIATLLDYPHPHVRFFTIDIVLTCATKEDGPIIAAVASRLGSDPASSVRWKILDFLSRASVDQIGAAATSTTNTNHLAGLRLLLHKDNAAIRSFLDSPDPVLRKYGAIAASRSSDRSLRDYVRSVADEEIQNFMDR